MEAIVIKSLTEPDGHAAGILDMPWFEGAVACSASLSATGVTETATNDFEIDMDSLALSMEVTHDLGGDAVLELLSINGEVTQSFPAVNTGFIHPFTPWEMAALWQPGAFDTIRISGGTAQVSISGVASCVENLGDIYYCPITLDGDGAGTESTYTGSGYIVISLLSGYRGILLEHDLPNATEVQFIATVDQTELSWFELPLSSTPLEKKFDDCEWDMYADGGVHTLRIATTTNPQGEIGGGVMCDNGQVPGYFIPDATLEYEFEIENPGSEDVKSFGIGIELPVLWDYVGVTASTMPTDYGVINDGRYVKLLWIAAPTFPLDITLSLDAPDILPLAPSMLKVQVIDYLDEGGADVKDIPKPIRFYLGDIAAVETQTTIKSQRNDIPSGSISGCPIHSADQNENNIISLSELLRVIQFFNSGGYHCEDTQNPTEDGYRPGVNGAFESCPPHNSDYNPQDWIIQLTELLRLIQFFNVGGYQMTSVVTEDGFATGPPSGPQEATIDIEVIDGAELMLIECESWVDPGATALDGCGVDRTNDIIKSDASTGNPLNPPSLVVGEYILRYTVDGVSVDRNITVVPSQPALELSGDATMTIACQPPSPPPSPLADPGYIVNAPCLGAHSVEVDPPFSSIDLTVPGIYDVTYTLRNFQQVPLDVKTRRVIVECALDLEHEPLQRAMETILDKSPVMASDFIGRKVLNLVNFGISELSGIEIAKDLEVLRLHRNAIDDLTPLAALTKLRELHIPGHVPRKVRPGGGNTGHIVTYQFQDNGGIENDDFINRVIDISPLATLTQLEVLDLRGDHTRLISPLPTNEEPEKASGNSIHDISPLANLTNLRELNLSGNAITDISALQNLTQLEELILGNNYLGEVWQDSQAVALDDLDWSVFTNLERLHLDFNDLEDISPLADLGHDLAEIGGYADAPLRYLDLRFNGINDLGPLANMVDLLELNLYHNALDNTTTLSDLSAMSALKFLYLGENALSDAQLAPLVTLAATHDLERINLIYNADPNIVCGDNAADLREDDDVALFIGIPEPECIPGLKSLVPSESHVGITMGYSIEGSLEVLYVNNYPGQAPMPSAGDANPDGVLNVYDSSMNDYQIPIYYPEMTLIEEEQDSEEIELDYDTFHVTVPLSDYADITMIEFDPGTGIKSQLASGPPQGITLMPNDTIPISAIKMNENYPHDEQLMTVVYIGDGFSAEEMGAVRPAIIEYTKIRETWGEAIADAYNFLVEREPFTSYEPYFQVYRLDYISLSTGAPSEAENALKLDSLTSVVDEELYQFLLSLDTAIGYTMRRDKTRLEDWRAAARNRTLSYFQVPEMKVAQMINGFFSAAATSTRMWTRNGKVENGTNRAFVNAHEVGHLLGPLGDARIDFGSPTIPDSATPPRSQPNTFRLRNGRLPQDLSEIPWKHWLVYQEEEMGLSWDFGVCAGGTYSGNSQAVKWTCVESGCQAVDCVALGITLPEGSNDGIVPLPTQASTPEVDSVVGLYPGGKHRRWGFRAQPGGIMSGNSLDAFNILPSNLFNRIEREQLIIDLVAQGSSFSDASLSRVGDEVTGTLTLRSPLSHDLIVYWEVIPENHIPKSASRPVFVDGHEYGVDTTNVVSLQTSLEHDVSAITGDFTVRLTVHDPAFPSSESVPWVLPGYEYNFGGLEVYFYDKVMIRSQRWFCDDTSCWDACDGGLEDNFCDE